MVRVIGGLGFWFLSFSQEPGVPFEDDGGGEEQNRNHSHHHKGNYADIHAARKAGNMPELPRSAAGRFVQRIGIKNQLAIAPVSFGDSMSPGLPRANGRADLGGCVLRNGMRQGGASGGRVRARVFFLATHLKSNPALAVWNSIL